MNKYFDYIIIGAGPAGLYAGYRIKQLNPVASVIILERKSYIGGRTRMFPFHGHMVNSGAYAIRPEKDYYGMKLLSQFKMNTNPINVKFDHSRVIDADVQQMITAIKKEVTQNNAHYNTKFFITSYFGEGFYNSFLDAIGRSDFEFECIKDTLGHYGLEDNFNNTKLLPVDWNLFCDKLSSNLNIKYNIDITDIVVNSTSITARCYDTTYQGSKVIIAADILTIRRLLPGISLYDTIDYQSFMRIYGVFNIKGKTIMGKHIKKYTLLSGPLQNIIPVDMSNSWTFEGVPEDGMYVIAFADNGRAQCLTEFMHDTEENRHVLENMIMKSLNCKGLEGTLMTIRSYYMNPGSHYYKRNPVNQSRDDFIRETQRPYHNVYVIGEVVSLHQGWVEGALASVENIVLSL